jgi:hypothetical protein
MANRKTTLNQLITGSAFTNQGSWTVELDFGAAGTAATATDTANSVNRISAYDQYEILTADVATGYLPGDIITILSVDYASSAPDTDVIVDGAGAAAAGVITAKALSVTDPAINYFLAGDFKESVAVSLLFQTQSAVTYDPSGPTWTAVNQLPNGVWSPIFSNDNPVSLDVTISVNDLYSVNTLTGEETRGNYTLNLALYAPSAAEFYTVATLEAGDAITLTGLNTEVVIDPAGPTTENCQLVIYNIDPSSDSILTDITGSVSFS